MPLTIFRVPLYNDGSAVRDYIYVDDHCRAIDRVLHDGRIGEAYNVGVGGETSGLELATAVLEILSKPASLMQFVRDRPGHDYRYALDIGKIQTELNWEPQVDFREGLQVTVRWYLENQGWWRPLKSGDYWEYYKRNYKPLE